MKFYRASAEGATIVVLRVLKDAKQVARAAHRDGCDCCEVEVFEIGNRHTGPMEVLGKWIYGGPGDGWCWEDYKDYWADEVRPPSPWECLRTKAGQKFLKNLLDSPA